MIFLESSFNRCKSASFVTVISLKHHPDVALLEVGMILCLHNILIIDRRTIVDFPYREIHFKKTIFIH